MAELVTTRMTATEFLALPETNQPTELLNGVMIVSPAPIPKHQLTSNRLEIVISSLMPDGLMLHAPIDLYFDDGNIVQPDIVWITENSRCVVGDKYLHGSPELIVEIFSPGTERQDRKQKFNLYQRHGVSEYWMVDPAEMFIEVYVLENGSYKRLGIFEPGESFISPTLGGKTVEVSRIF